jgi:hypothetical protein
MKRSRVPSEARTRRRRSPVSIQTCARSRYNRARFTAMAQSVPRLAASACFERIKSRVFEGAKLRMKGRCGRCAGLQGVAALAFATNNLTLVLRSIGSSQTRQRLLSRLVTLGNYIASSSWSVKEGKRPQAAGVVPSCVRRQFDGFDRVIPTGSLQTESSSGSNDSPWRRKLPVGCFAGRAPFSLRFALCCASSCFRHLQFRDLPVRRNAPREIL